MTESTFQANVVFDFAAIQAQAHASKTVNGPAINSGSKWITKRESRLSCRAPRPKVVTGPPKTLYLPRLCNTDDMGSVLIVRRESPWDTYHPVVTYDGAGKVTIATRCSRPSRMVAIRKYPKQDTRRLIGRFGRLQHRNVLSLLECYLDVDFAYFLVDDLALTLGHLIACPTIRPAEFELGCIMVQVGGLLQQEGLE
jgi:hypothetical protein